jgi:DnaJ-class molecular chaperone
MQRDQAMQYFRKLAKLLHPDKNHHHLAKDAFQKLHQALQAIGGSGNSSI